MERIAITIEINLKLIEIVLQLSISFSMAILPYTKDSLKVSITLRTMSCHLAGIVQL